jgi:polysaccharide biosynthesis/export protein
MKPIITTAAVLCLCIWAAGLGGCGKKAVSLAELERSFPDRSETIDAFNQLMLASSDLSADRGEYLLGPGDLLEIKVFESDRLNTTARVSSRGDVSLPLLGEVNLKGKTAAEAERLIENRYGETHIRDPHVSIFVKEHFSQRVTVVGQVTYPGTYDYPSRLRLLDAIALAGGLKGKAGSEVHVRRIGGTQGADTQQTFVVNLDKLVNEGRTDLNITINGGDVVFIPEAGSFYVDGAVRRPGEYLIRGDMTLQEALLSAGGLAGYAKPQNSILMRKREDGRREEIKINLQEPDVSDTIMMADGDIVYVHASFWGKVLHGGGIHIGIPGTGVSYRDPER